MIETEEFVDFEVLVAGLFQGLPDGRKILFGQDLFVFLAVEDQHGAG